jgi:exopolysaccharide biosynthesis polyprenyl glycosylphosphotransferase
MLFAFGMYEAENLRPKTKNLKNLVASLILSFLISIAFFYIFEIFGISPKTNLVVNIVVFILIFILARRLVTYIYKKKFTEKILLIGEDMYIEKLKKHFEKNTDHYQVKLQLARLDENSVQQIQNQKYDIVIYSKQYIDQNILSQNIKTFFQKNISFMDTRKAFEEILNKIPEDLVDNILLIDNTYKFENKIYEIVTRGAETILAILGLALLSPILFIIFITLKIQDGGPFVYSQKRIGKNGKEFKIYKIRSMIINAEKNGAQWSTDTDNRITKVGKILRDTHLDESLQLLNIIKGDISIVGPRPERREFIVDIEKEIKKYDLRHLIKPGITGWAQINYKYGSSIEDAKEKFEYDLYYVKNRNIFLDVVIIIRTIQRIFFKN